MKRFKLVSAWFIIFLNAALLIQVLFHEQLSFPIILQLTGRLHPVLLHLPIALVLLVCGLLIFSTDAFRNASRSILDLLLPLTALLTVVSALSGVALSTEEGYSGDVLFKHMNLGTALSLLAAMLNFAYDYGRFKLQVIKGLSALALVAVVLTGHYGAVITHGEDFITGVFKTPGEKSGPETITDSTTLFAAAVMPVLDKKCNSCHNPSKKKGGLDMTSAERLLEGGEDGAVWVSGNPEESLMLKRIHLPAEDEDHMPPIGKAQLTKDEIAILRLFISSGADVTKTIASTAENDSLRMFINRSFLALQPELRSSNLDFADPKIIQDLNTPSRSISQLSLHEPSLQASFFLAARFDENSVKELSPVADQLVELNLSGMPITIETLKELSKFPNLKKINLNKTPLTDAMLADGLKNIGTIEVISVASTKITLKGLVELTTKNGIRSVYCWDTQVKPEEFSSLRKDYPSIDWNEGFRPDEKEMLRLTPPILVNENRILAPNETIKLKHNLPGVSIRYLINSDILPDSVNGEIFSSPLRALGPTTIKARAVKVGWKSSTLMEASFFTAGIKPATAKLLTPPNKDYRAKGSETLIDATAGDQENFRDGQWLGYKENILSAEFELEESKSIGTVAVSYLKNIGSYIMPPLSIEVWGGNTPQQYQKVGLLKPTQPSQYDPNLTEAARITVNASFKYWKVVVAPVSKLPPWHGGKGEKGWVMIDEIFFYEKIGDPIL